MKSFPREALRLKRMAKLASGSRVVADLGWAQYPNPYIRAERLFGIDLVRSDAPENYSDVFVGEISEFLESPNFEPLDSLLAGEILEHVTNPIDFLNDCFKAIIPGGRIILSTPNPNSFIERVLTITLSRRYFYTTEHIFIFPQRWLIRLMEIAGFNQVKLHSGGFPIPGVGLVPFPRAYCYQTIAVGVKPAER